MGSRAREFVVQPRVGNGPVLLGMPEESTPFCLAADSSHPAFAEIPHVPVAAMSVSARAWRSRIVYGCVAACADGLLAVYLTRSTSEVDPNAPRVSAIVSGIHCPIQCGLRVGKSLERLPFVVPGSVTADPRTGIVTFAVTSLETVDEDQIRRAIERAGFGVLEVKIPMPQPREG